MSKHFSLTEKGQIVCASWKNKRLKILLNYLSQVNRIFKKYNKTENVVVPKKWERPKEFTERQKRYITKMVKSNEVQNVPEVRRILSMSNMKVPSMSSIKNIVMLNCMKESKYLNWS